MSSPLLLTFSHTLIRRLQEQSLIELAPEHESATIEALAAHLSTVQLGSLISEIARALLRDARVVELYADDDAIKTIVDDLSADEAGLKPA